MNDAGRYTVKTSGIQITDRQHQIVGLMRTGLNNCEIAKKIKVSRSAVAGHCTVIYRAYKVTNRLAFLARELGPKGGLSAKLGK